MITALVASYGLTFALMQDKAKPLTDLLISIPIFIKNGESFFMRMFSCAYCTGFHAGWIVWLTLYAFDATLPVPILVWSFISAIFCYAADTVLQAIEKE